MNYYIIGLAAICILILILILLVDLWKIKEIKDKFSLNGPINSDKYYELKWRINLLLSITTIAALSLGIIGYSFRTDLTNKILDLTTLTNGLQDSIQNFESKLSDMSVELGEKEKQVADLNEDIKIISAKNKVLHNNIKNNIGKIYKDLRNEDVKEIMSELENYPEKIDIHIGTLENVRLSGKYYQLIKKGTFLDLYNDLKNEMYLCLLFKNYSKEFIEDISLINNITSSIRYYQSAFKCMNDEDLINFISNFINYLYENDGILKNESELNWLHSSLSSIGVNENKDFQKIANVIYRLMKTKDDKFFFYETIRNRRIELQEQNKEIKIDHKVWNYPNHQLPYFKLLLGQYKDKINSAYQNELLQEIQDILKQKIG